RLRYWPLSGSLASWATRYRCGVRSSVCASRSARPRATSCWTSCGGARVSRLREPPPDSSRESGCCNSSGARCRGCPRPTVGCSPAPRDPPARCPAVYDQGCLGSCTGNGIAGALQYGQGGQRQADVFKPSRLFIYYNERTIEGTVDEDAGAMLRDGIKTVAKQ